MSALPEQLAFPDLVVPELPREATLDERFCAFCRANPHVYDHLRRNALELVRTGHKRISIKMLIEVLRWSALRTRDAHSDYRINNSYSSRFARLLAASEPELADAFETRELKS